MDAEMIRRLAEPFPASDIEWKIQATNQEKTKALVVPFIDSRAVQYRLDEVAGAGNWHCRYKPWHTVERQDKKSRERVACPSQLCGLYLYDAEHGRWIGKWDGAENTEIEPVKGGLSDAFKRAAVLWGIGRYIYGLENTWVSIDPSRPKEIPQEELKKLAQRYERLVKEYRKTGHVPPAAGIPSEPPSPVGSTGSAQQPGSFQKPNRIPPASAGSPESSFQYDYTVKGTKPLPAGDTVNTLVYLEGRDGRSITAIMRGRNEEVVQGICLKNARLTTRATGKNSYITLDQFEIAA